MKPLIAISLPGAISEQALKELQANIKIGGLGDDYNFLFVPTNAASAEVKVFYDKDITEKSLADLQKELTKAKLIQENKDTMTILDVTMQSLQSKIDNMKFYQDSPVQIKYLEGILSNLKLIRQR